jgi:taurine dioxygenase
MTRRSGGLEIRPLTGALGATVQGIDLAELTDEQWGMVHAAWLEHLVLFFPRQNLTPEAQLELGRRFGELEIHPFLEKASAEHPELVILDSDRSPAAEMWHSDVTFNAAPPRASLLQMMTPPKVGGDTMWTNQYLVYESLSTPIRELVDRLTAVHSAVPFGRPEAQAIHPAVVVHPETGRRLLYVNRTFTQRFVELDPGESRALLAYLCSLPEDPRFQCRYRWEAGDLAIWDNRCTQHYAVGDYQTRRIVRRVTALGTEPVGLSNPDPWPDYDAALGRARFAAS